MEHYTLPIGRLFNLAICTLLLSININAQVQEYFTLTFEIDTDQPAKSSQPQEDIESTSNDLDRYFIISAEDDFTTKGDDEVKEEIPSYFRVHKDLPSKFSGYVIELLQSDEKLPRNYPLFNRFGNIHVKHLPNGKYSYCIIANFKKSNRVKIFANEVIKPHAPDAQPLRYRKGKCTKM